MACGILREIIRRLQRDYNCLADYERLQALHTNVNVLILGLQSMLAATQRVQGVWRGVDAESLCDVAYDELQLKPRPPSSSTSNPYPQSRPLYFYEILLPQRVLTAPCRTLLGCMHICSVHSTHQASPRNFTAPSHAHNPSGLSRSESIF